MNGSTTFSGSRPWGPLQPGTSLMAWWCALSNFYIHMYLHKLQFSNTHKFVPCALILSWLYFSWFCSKAIARILAINLDDSYYDCTWRSRYVVRCSKPGHCLHPRVPHFDALEYTAGSDTIFSHIYLHTCEVYLIEIMAQIRQYIHQVLT